MATCAGCGKPVIWIKQANGGKALICDPLKVEMKDGDNRTLIMDDGSVLVRPATGTRGWESHFATCSQANKFRRRK